MESPEICAVKSSSDDFLLRPPRAMASEVATHDGMFQDAPDGKRRLASCH